MYILCCLFLSLFCYHISSLHKFIKISIENEYSNTNIFNDKKLCDFIKTQLVLFICSSLLYIERAVKFQNSVRLARIAPKCLDHLKDSSDLWKKSLDTADPIAYLINGPLDQNRSS